MPVFRFLPIYWVMRLTDYKMLGRYCNDVKNCHNYLFIKLNLIYYII
jgi:hypothetical protein